LSNWYTNKKRGFDLENYDCCRKKTKKRKKINIQEFGRELGKENWSLGICLALYLLFFSGSIIV
jgi:hypothetical protein